MKSMNNLIKEKAAAYFPQLVGLRRHLHTYPELSFEEHATAAFVSSTLEAAGISVQKGVAGTGLTALIEGRNPSSRCIALRADMDALPITEANDVPYRSQHEGVMHACGHDVHTTCLLGAAMILQELRDDFEGTIKLIFQPGEEKSPGGASLMIAAGVLQDPVPEAIFGLHVYPHLPVGTLGFRPGQYMASADEIYITIKGKGGHAALPHQTVDPIATAALVVTGLQQVVSRRSNPLSPTVLTFGKISGGHTTNVIPEQVELAGTLRTFDEAWRQEALDMIRKMTEDIAGACGAGVEVYYPGGYPPLYNDPDLTMKARSIAADYIGPEMLHELDRRMGAEDFAFYTRQIPGCFFRLGTNTNHEQFTAPVHNPHFDVDERCLETGAGFMAYLAINALS
jgi:amidohydrolase